MDDLVSVIMPIYKVERFLKNAIDSVLRQTYRNLEIILVDDGSPDSCPAICDEYAKKDSRIKVIHKENGGLSSARNAGLDIAKGKYIVLFDTDDLLNENYVRILYDICEKYDCDIAQCDFLMTNEESLTLPTQKDRKVEVYDAKEIMKKFCVETNLVKFWVAWNKMYRKELFDDIRYPLGRIHEDMFTSHKLLWKSRKTAITNLYLYYYLRREDSITGQQHTIQERIDTIDALKEELDFFKEKKLDYEYEFMLLKLYATICQTCDNPQDFAGYETKKDIYDEVLRNCKNEALNMRDVILKLPGKGMRGKIHSIYPTLSDSEKKSFEKIYGSQILKETVIAYNFPMEKISKGDKIAIYGAGGVGQSFYNQITEMNYGEVAVWVDNGFKSHLRRGLPVQPVDALFRHYFDKLIIAIQNKDIANEIKENLIGWGIDENKIIAEYPVIMDRGTQMRAEFLEDTRKIKIGESNQRWILMNTPDHDNLGDHLLTAGTIAFLNDYFPDEELVEVTGRQWDLCKADIIPKISQQDIIAIVGGGFMGDLWTVQDERVKDIIEKFKDNRIVFFPQTFYYENEESDILKGDIELYNSRKNMLFLHREKHSYDFFTKNVVKNIDRNACFPDLALYLKGRKIHTDRRGILFCLRLDKESVNDTTRSRLLDVCGAVGEEVMMIDTVLDRSVLRSERQDELCSILDTISKGELLITDRLHAMIMAVLTGTPCIVLDNLTKKVSGVYAWIKELDYVTCVDAGDVDANLIREYMAKTDHTYDRSIVHEKFNNMYEYIKNWKES